MDAAHGTRPSPAAPVACAVMAANESGTERESLEIAIRHAEFVYTRLESRLQVQFALVDGFDRKLATSIGFSGAVVGLFVAAIVIGASLANSTAFIGTGLSAAIGVTAALFSANLLVVVWAYGYFATWADAPGTAHATGREDLHSQDYLDLLAQSAETVRRAIAANSRPLRIKGRLTAVSISLAGATGLSVAAATFIAVAA